MPNAFALFMLAAWPLVTLMIFARMKTEQAIVWSLLLGYLFLPEPPASFDPPLMTALDKHNIPAIATFLALLQRHGLKGGLLPESRVAKLLVLVFLFSPVASAFTNTDAIRYGIVLLEPHDAKAAVGMVMQQFFLVLPFLIARQFLAGGGSLRTLMHAIMVAGLIYSAFMLIEIRLSPQLNNWIYGYYQHDFGQTMRFGGWRPMVFLYHGIWVAFFTMMAVACAWTLWKTDDKSSRGGLFLAALYLTAILVLAKSLGAILYALLLLPAILLIGPKARIRLALVLALLATAYPVLKAADLTYQDEIVDAFARYVPDRAQSLEFRFDNETALMARAMERPLFGYGIFGRNHIYNPVNGRIETVTDGRWIILIGTYGWVGYIAEFGLLLWPLLLIWWQSRGPAGATLSPLVPTFALLLAINVVDLLPNATITTLTWLLAGALLGHAENPLRRASGQAAQPAVAPSRYRLAWKPAM